MTIRKARMSDIGGLLKLINGYARDGIMLPRNEFELSESIRDFTVAVEGDTLVGCAALHFYGPSIAEVRSLAVAPETKGGGTGRLLMEALEREAVEFDLDALFAFTYVPGFFTKLGYVEVDRGELPLKAWKDCLRCPKFQACDEIAVLKMLNESASLPSGKAALFDEQFGQFPILRQN
ncbi:MAG: N-acetyltransferase [Bryobacter sp.]|jgi:amino-acid N-acetyltransferase|nr:N-acetyltransferase [Bryobacter sp.]